MILIHHLGISQSDRIVWLCEELGIPYELKRYERDPTTQLAPAAYRALHPCGTAPVIYDGDLVLAESGAIIEYIIAKYGNGRLSVRADQLEFPNYLFWLHFANGSVMPSAMIDFLASMVDPAGASAPLRAFRERTARAYGLIENRLSASPYLAGGEFTAADLINFFALTTLRVFASRDFTASPHTRAYIKKIAQRPAYQRAMQKADPGFLPPLD